MPTSKTIGPNEVWKTINRLSEEILEMKNHIFRAFAETDRKFQETDRKFQKTDQKFQETREQFKETDKRIEMEWKKTTKAIGDLTGKWGQLVESLITPAALGLFQKRGIPVQQIYQRAKNTRNGEVMEIDLLLQNGEALVAIEIKSTLGTENVQEFITKLQRFKEFFPVFSDKKVFGAVSGLTFTGQSDRFAYKMGLFVLAHKGEAVKILNDSKFKPKTW